MLRMVAITCTQFPHSIYLLIINYDRSNVTIANSMHCCHYFLKALDHYSKNSIPKFIRITRCNIYLFSNVYESYRPMNSTVTLVLWRIYTKQCLARLGVVVKEKRFTTTSNCNFLFLDRLKMELGYKFRFLAQFDINNNNYMMFVGLRPNSSRIFFSVSIK